MGRMKAGPIKNSISCILITCYEHPTTGEIVRLEIKRGAKVLYQEDFREFDTAVRMLPHIWRRFDDETKPPRSPL